MSLREKLGEYVPALARKPAMPRETTLSLKPIRNPSVTWAVKTPDDDAAGTGRVALTVPLRHDGFRKVLTRLLSMPVTKTIELDEYGGELWDMCDGTHTVEQFVTHTCRKYQLNRRQAEVSVLAFLRMLLERRLVGVSAANLKGEENVSTDHDPKHGRKRRPAAQHARRRH